MTAVRVPRVPVAGTQKAVITTAVLRGALSLAGHTPTFARVLRPVSPTVKGSLVARTAAVEAAVAVRAQSSVYREPALIRVAQRGR